MAKHIPRLLVPQSLVAGQILVLDDADRVHHLRDVLRLEAGDALRPFNADDGEFDASVSAVTKKSITLQLGKKSRAAMRDDKRLHLLFAPLKRTNTELVVEKAAELGAARITPVVTDHTQTRTLNAERLNNIMTDAIEQCGGFSLPQLDEPIALATMLRAWPAKQTLYVALESERDSSPASKPTGDVIAILIGPEGGWSDGEVALLKKQKFVKAISLGSHILRAETAAIAALGIARLA